MTNKSGFHRATAAHAAHPALADAAEARAYAELLMRDASVRVTAARTNVLSTLLTTRAALSHQDIQDNYADMDRVTLYRALDCLTEAGLAHKIAVDDRIFRYSAGIELHEQAHGGHQSQRKSHAQHQHGHFKCTRCAKVFCLDETADATFIGNVLHTDHAGSSESAAAQLQSALEKTLGHGFQSHEVELTIKGWCADCSTQETLIERR